jgi:hypothetical protein
MLTDRRSRPIVRSIGADLISDLVESTADASAAGG